MGLRSHPQATSARTSSPHVRPPADPGHGEISERSGIAGIETIRHIEAGQNFFINSSLIYAATDETYSFTPTLTRIIGDHTLKAGANILLGEVNYFQNNTPGVRLRSPARRRRSTAPNPGSTGDPFASFLIGQPTGGTYQSSSFTYGRSCTLLCRGFLADQPRLTMNLGLRLEQPGAYSRQKTACNLQSSGNQSAASAVLPI